MSEEKTEISLKDLTINTGAVSNETLAKAALELAIALQMLAKASEPPTGYQNNSIGVYINGS